MRKFIIYVSLALIGIASGAAYQYDELFVVPPLRAMISSQMKDPDSAKFRNESLTKSGWLCGEINSKNGLGGYSGFERYISSKDVRYIESQGVLGRWSDQDIIASMDNEIGVLTILSDAKVANPDMDRASKEEIQKMTTKAFFADKWNQICKP